MDRRIEFVFWIDEKKNEMRVEMPIGKPIVELDGDDIVFTWEKHLVMRIPRKICEDCVNASSKLLEH